MSSIRTIKYAYRRMTAETVVSDELHKPLTGPRLLHTLMASLDADDG